MLKIVSYEVFGLHDVLNYALPSEGEFSDTVILYGDNGCGKTTLLNMLFHLLSGGDKNGHRTYLAKIPFRQIIIKLSDGTIIGASRREGALTFPVEYNITRPGGAEIRWNHFSKGHMEQYLRDQYIMSFNSAHQMQLNMTDDHRESFMRATGVEKLGDSDSASEERFLAELKNVGLDIYFITSDRRIISDTLGDVTGNENERNQSSRNDDPIVFARTRYLEAALAFAGRWVGRQLIRASNAGSKSSNDIYSDLIMKLANADLNENITIESEIDSLRNDLKNIRIRARGYVKYGLAPRLEVKKILDVLNLAEGKNKNAVKMVVRPYISSLQARYAALEPIYNSIRTFTENLNEFFNEKTISYIAGRGFKIANDRGQNLEVGQLSSGEQQLLLMFCYALAVGEKGSCLIIDEPEISLNIKWQRKFIDALKQIAIGEGSQLILATHSIELLAQHSEKVHPLNAFENSKNNKVIYEVAASDN